MLNRPLWRRCTGLDQGTQLNFSSTKAVSHLIGPTHCNDLDPLIGNPTTFTVGSNSMPSGPHQCLVKGKNLKKLARSNVKVSVSVDSEPSTELEEQPHDLELRISQLQTSPYSASVDLLKRQLQDELDKWRLRLELLWRQKSREVWILQGDQNTRFFHASTVVNRKCNFIGALKNDDGSWLQSPSAIRSFLLDKFEALFHSDNIRPDDDLYSLFHADVSHQENIELCRVPMASEIHDVLKSMHPIKIPGPDGMPALFYQFFWSIVGSSVVELLQNFFHSGIMPKWINKTYVVLVPKCINACSFSQLRPISLCNVTYKLISKILANRLRPLLNRLISPNQSAFVPGRWIGENTLLVNEIVHTMKRKRGKGGLMGLKIDMQKAFDRVEWNVLAHILEAMGFSGQFISLIMHCMSSATFKLLLNGNVVGSFKVERGLR